MHAWNKPVRNGFFGVLGILTLATMSPAQDSKGTNGLLLRAPDHVLVWSQRPDATEHLFKDLGFTIHKGQTYPEGITSSTAIFGDWSYLELLHFSDPAKAAGNAQATAELEFVARGPGANSFAIQVGNIDAAAELLRRRDFSVAAVAPDMVDPDGPSGLEPPRPASWRDFHFATSPVTGVELFFIQYPPEPPASPEDEARFRLRSTHANTARRLSAIWVLVADLEGEADIYRRMGFAIGPVVDVEHLNAHARVATLGTGAVILAQSARLPKAFQTRGRTGSRVIGLSFEVASIGTARELLSVRHEPREVQGPLGHALLLPLSESLGMFVEFHETDAMSR